MISKVFVASRIEELNKHKEQMLANLNVLAGQIAELNYQLSILDKPTEAPKLQVAEMQPEQ